MFCAKLGWPLDRQDIADFIGAFVEESKIKNQFVDGKPSRDFMLGFLKRNKSKLATRRGEILKQSRAHAENPDIIIDFIDTVQEAYKIAKIDTNNRNDA